jgi:soluble lytic murein transglycosylase-like protein
MHRFQFGRRRVVFAFVLTPLISLISVPSMTSTPAAITPPDDLEYSRLEGLVGWMLGRPAAQLGAPERLVQEVDLVAAVSELGPRGDLTLFTPTRRSAAPAAEALPVSTPFRAEIVSVANRYRLDTHLLAAMVEVESSFDPRSVSPRGAMGLMQIMPAMARVHGIADPFDPASNLDTGAHHFSLLLEQYDGRIELALAAYNAGPAAVNRFGGVPPYRETSRYVEKVMARARMGAGGFTDLRPAG